MSFGQHLKRLRLKNNLNQLLLAEKIGVCRSSIAQYESDMVKPPLETILKLREVFNCSYEALLGEISEKQKVKIEAQKNIKQELKEKTLELLCLINEVD